MTHSPFITALINAGIPAGMAGLFAVLILVLVLWTFVWKGLALWHAARNRQTAWFVIMLVVNTLGILEILYLAFFRKNKNNVVHTTTVTHTVSASTPGVEVEAQA